MLFWTIFPWSLGYLDYFIATEEISKADAEKYFGLPILLPENINKFPIFEIVEVCNLMSVSCNVTLMTACYMIMFILTYHAATLFRLIRAAFEDFDYFENKLRNEYELGDDTKSQCHSIRSNHSKMHNFFGSPGKERSEHCDDGNTNQEHTDAFRSTKENKFKSSINNTNVSIEFNPKNNEEFQNRLNKYLVHCVEFHQAVIR
ncbi:hypothetical protein C0J52_13420 [Blattella germanica]|nr:hypothetical protein C0J52_13420 [Blattella germanica]